MSARRYLAWFFATILALSAITISVNVAIDPYLVFGSPRIQGINKVKVAINDYVAIAKSFEQFRNETDILLAGNSRIELGLDPDHHCFKKSGLQVYNLGIPGASVGQQLNYALNVIYARPVQRVFLSVDFVDFLVKDDMSPPQEHSVVVTDLLPRRFDKSSNPDYEWEVAKTRFRAAFSLNALTDSVKTILLQGQFRSDRLKNGFNPAHDFALATALEGARTLFEQKMVSLQSRFAPRLDIHYIDGTPVREFVLFSRFLDIAVSEDVDVIVLTNPFHEMFWDLIRQRGLMDTYEEWLHEIQRRVLTAGGVVEMWDFSGDSKFIHEQVTPSGTGGPPLEWFWEPSHYRKSLGDKMLDVLMAAECDSGTEFGRQLAGDRISIDHM